jgi:hypothetical protein
VTGRAADASTMSVTKPAVSPKGRRWGLYAPLVVLAITCARFIVRSRFHTTAGSTFSLFDDAMISMRFARNLANGHGLRWNAGATPVEGYSNFLWTLWMAVPHALGVAQAKASLFVMVSGAALLVATAAMVHQITAMLAGPRLRHAPAVATWLTALSYPLVFWTMRGMEVGLVAAELTAAVLLALRLREGGGRRDLVLFGAVLALGALTRDDTVLPLAVVVAFTAVRSPHRWRILCVGGGALALAVVGHTAFRILYYGDPLPNTYYLKLGGIPLRTRLSRGISVDGQLGTRTLYAPAAFAALYFALVRRGVAFGAVMVAAVFLSTVAYSTYVGGDAWEDFGFANRYVASALPMLAVLAGLGVAALLRAPRRAQLLSGAGLVAVFIGAAVVAKADVVPRTALELTPGGKSLLALAAVGAVAVAIAVAFAHRRRRGGWAVPGLLIVAIAVSASGLGWRHWLTSNSEGIYLDQAATRYGLTLRSVTKPDARIAVTWAGAIPYFSDRPAVDELGKSDHKIAREPTHLPFRPGHTKWDDAYSIGRLRPDIVGQLRYDSDALCQLGSWGYERVAPTVYVRSDTTRVSPTQLAQALHALHWDLLPGPPPCHSGT